MKHCSIVRGSEVRCEAGGFFRFIYKNSVGKALAFGRWFFWEPEDAFYSFELQPFMIMSFMSSGFCK